MATTTFLLLLGFIVILTTPLQAQTPDDIVPISWVKNAIVKGAACLDGTPAAYYYEQGQGDGANNWLVFLQGSAGMLPPQCTSIMTPSHCLFPQYLLEYVTTPVFIAMSSFDQVQIKWNLFKEDEVCLVSQNCTHDRKQAIQELRSDVLAALPKAPPLSRGIWMTSCIAHEMTYYSTLTIIGNKTFADVFIDWYFGFNYLQVIDTQTEPRNCSEYGIVPKPL
nr:pectin acetylesterase 8-like [Ipomoea batatas]